MEPNYQQAARDAALRHGLDPDFFHRLIKQESGFNPSAVSPAGALGIAQIMPSTARGWKVNPLDPMAALDVSAKNLKHYENTLGSLPHAAIAYNAGPNRAANWGGMISELPEETQRFLRALGLVGGADSPSSIPAETSTRSPFHTPGNKMPALSFPEHLLLNLGSQAVRGNQLDPTAILLSLLQAR